MYKLVKKIMEKNGLNPDVVLDVCFAICMADRFDGSNRLELSVDRFVLGADDAWNSVLGMLGVGVGVSGSIGGIGSAGGTGGTGGAKPLEPLPEVQRWRVICDALVICCGLHDDGIHLTSEASTKVASLKGVMFSCDDYSDINEVKSVLTKLCGESLTFPEIHDLEARLKELSDGNSEIDSCIREAWSGVRLPDKFTYIEKGDMRYEDENIALSVLQERLMYGLESEILKKVKGGWSVNSVGTNLKLNKFIDSGVSVGFGTVSSGGYAKDIPLPTDGTLMCRKLEKIFVRGKVYSIDCLDGVFVLLKSIKGVA